MNNNADKIKAFIIKKLNSNPSDIVAIASEHFNVSRVTIHRHLNVLIKQAKIIKVGNTKNIKYYKKENLDLELKFKINFSLSEFDILDKYFDSIFKKFKNNIYDICSYGFTEIFNNAIDHSGGYNIIVKTEYTNHSFKLIITDDGIGIFQGIKDYLKLYDLKESVLELSKGKFTTMPMQHSGEGIFFSSRIFDRFEIISNNIYYLKDNINDDWSVCETNSIKNKQIVINQKGTQVIMTINKNSKKNIIDIFKKYQDANSLAFDRTDILVKLSDFNQETLISRSQAKRIAIGLEKFNHITLDFKDIRLIGQGFVDEIFRVFTNYHPHLTINYINANSDVEFMIKRGQQSPVKKL